MLVSELRPPEARGWHGRLAVSFEARGGRTVMSDRAHVGPLYVQRPFYPEADGTCHLYVLHPPGGVVGGDELEIDVAVRRGGSALITTPAATKLYRAPHSAALLTNRLRVEAGGVLEWLPGETLAFGGSRARLTTTVALEPGAHFLGWEITCLGRPASGDVFATGRLDQRFELSIGRRPVVLDRTLTEAEGSVRRGAWGWAGRSVHGLFLATVASPALSAELRASIVPERPGELFGVTTLGDVTVCRFLGERATDARELLARAWSITRRYLFDKPACAPRIWAT